MKAKQVNKIINYGIGISAAYFIGSAIAGAIKRKREGVGDEYARDVMRYM